MSLLILSNQQEEYDVKQTGIAGSEIPTDTGIQKPWNFTNRLTNAQIIPRNSRIAVQSCKIQRAPTFSVKGDTSFAVYLGLPTDAGTKYSISQGNSAPIQVILKQGSYTYDQFASLIQNALNDAISHPDYYNNVIVSPHFDGTTDEFAGFTYDFASQGKSNVLDVKDTLTDWGIAHPNTSAGNVAISVVDGNTQVRRTSADTDGSVYRCAVVCEQHPISALDKECIMDLFHSNYNSTGDYHYAAQGGLTRPKVDYGLHGKNYAPPWFKFNSNKKIPHRDLYADYSVDWAPKHDGTWVLRVHQVVADPTDKHTTTAEIAYWTGSGRVSAHITETDMYSEGSAGYGGRFKWHIQGEKIELFIASYDAEGEFSAWVLLCGLITDTLSNNFVPINQNKWVLYPQIALAKNGHIALIDKFESAPMPKSKAYGMKINAYDEDMWELDTRSSQEAGNTASKIIQGLDATTESVAWAIALVLAKSSPEDFTKKGVYESRFGGAHIGSNLGFRRASFKSSLQDGTAKQVDRTTGATAPSPCWILTSVGVPTSEASSMFIKCPTLSAKNLNYCKTLPSQILQHIPRFTDGAKNFGNLWWESNQLVYTRLKNAEPISLNDLTIQLVDKNERECKDLVGETIIVLHIDEDMGAN